MMKQHIQVVSYKLNILWEYRIYKDKKEENNQRKNTFIGKRTLAISYTNGSSSWQNTNSLRVLG